jgi:uncharacterized protein YecA (UPF0149 family)
VIFSRPEVEFYKCDDCSIETTHEIGTLQLDMCGSFKAHYDKKELLNTIIWAGVDGIDLSFGDAADEKFHSSFGEMVEEHKDLNKERGQFIIRWIGENLLQEKIIRLPNGFPTTLREKTEFDARQEANLSKLAEDMGIKIHPKRSADKKIPPNKPCPKCNSGKKVGFPRLRRIWFCYLTLTLCSKQYKKCCGAN